MANIQKLEEEIELNCCPEKAFEMMVAKQAELPNVCSNVVSNAALQQDDWSSVGSIRKWSCIVDGKQKDFIEKIESIDEKNKTIHRIMGGDILDGHYKKFESNVQIIPKRNNECCLIKLSYEFEKVNEDAPPPHQLMQFSLGTLKDLGSHISNAN